jgi:glucosamine--fructose-6-phosphate aminotransferase (isomerizing)
MCGIFGLTLSNRSDFTPQLVVSTINDLFILSESRGKEAAGLAIRGHDTIQVYKDAVSATRLIRSDEYKRLLDRTLADMPLSDDGTLAQPISFIGHSRLVTNGAQEVHDNNQPVVTSGLVGIHNGIIVNDTSLWQEFPSLQRNYEVDTEVILSLTRKFYAETDSWTEAIRSTFSLIEGTASIALLFSDADILALATNNGSLYTCSSLDSSVHLFASEQYILQVLTRRKYIRKRIGDVHIHRVKPGLGSIIDISSAQEEIFPLNGTSKSYPVAVPKSLPKDIVDVTPTDQRHSGEMLVGGPLIIVPESFSQRFAIDVQAIEKLRRCTRCVLPETMPFIEFDDEGVCNYCRNYQKIPIMGQDALFEFAERYRSKSGDPDCIVTFSGGRDSSFGVHYVTTVLGMNPITYTYDWGMVTDLARRNQARLCGKLGLEHILVSADIRKKRENIRKNVTAWLKRPDLGTVPLFMAGDKQYFFHANKLREQTGVQIIILCENLLETTGFKSGFCGIRPSFGTAHTYTLSLANKFKLAAYYGQQYLLNPAYINSSILDTIGAFASYYVIPHHYLNLYNYIMWDEEVIIPTLIQEYDWETATDTGATWRIGDGTAAFYNYIYYCIAGFSENDTFRSNQIREGMLSRARALELIYDENQPRFDSIQWYCDTIGIDMESALERIHATPKLYQ